MKIQAIFLAACTLGLCTSSFADNGYYSSQSTGSTQQSTGGYYSSQTLSSSSYYSGYTPQQSEFHYRRKHVAFDVDASQPAYNAEMKP